MTSFSKFNFTAVVDNMYAQFAPVNRGRNSARSAERSPHQGNTCINRGNSRFFRRAKKEFLIVLPQTRSMRTSSLETLFGHPLIFSYSFVFAWGVPKLLPDRRPQLLDLIFLFEVIFDGRQLSSCWLRYKITYLHVSSFKMFHSELFWRLFAWTSMATSVSSASSKTVWRHAIGWRHDSRTCSTMTSYFLRRFFLAVSCRKSLFVLFLLRGYVNNIRTLFEWFLVRLILVL